MASADLFAKKNVIEWIANLVDQAEMVRQEADAMRSRANILEDAALGELEREISRLMEAHGISEGDLHDYNRD